MKSAPPTSPAPGNQSPALGEIWDRLADFPQSHVQDGLLYLMERLKRVAGADDAVWVSVVRLLYGGHARKDHQLGWRGRAVVHLSWTEEKRKAVASAMKAQERDGGVPSSIEMAKLAGSFRTMTLRELHEMETFVLTEHYRTCFVPFGITDRMWSVFPVNESCEVAFILDRYGDRPRFTAADKRNVSTILRPLKAFHRSCVLAHGVTLGGHCLTPREQSLCKLLLGRMSEKEIAASLGLSFSTTRSYIQALYRKFGVKGRTGLMGLWLGS